MPRILAFDIETSRLPPKDADGNLDYSTVSVLQFGYAKNKDLDASGSFYIKHDPAPTIAPEAAAVNGITPEKLLLGITPNEAVERIGNEFDSADVIVGQNILAFDLPILSEFGVAPGPNKLIIDTKLIWKAYNCGMKLMPGERIEFFYGRVAGRRSEAKNNFELICSVLGVNNKRAHDAESDAVAALRVAGIMFDHKILRRVIGHDWSYFPA